MLAVAQDGELIDDSHQRVQSPALHEASEALQGILDDVARVIAEISPSVVRVLQPETTRFKASYNAMAPRVTLETLVRLAAVQANVPVEMLHRATASSRLGLEREGGLEKHIAEVLPTPVGKYWASGRRLAAVAAIAEAD